MYALARRIAGRPVNGVRRYFSHWSRLAQNGASYLHSRMSGRTYADHFAGLMDHSIREFPDWGRGIDYRFQLDYLIKHGLKPNCQLLDYGCGPLAAGSLMIAYLNPGKYVGIDISAGLIEAGAKRIREQNLTAKDPTLLHFQHGALPTEITDRQFDFIWAQSVLTHMPENEIDEMFHDVRRLMYSKSIFFATFGRTYGRPRHVGFMHWYYEPNTLRILAIRNGLCFEIMQDWKHPLDPNGMDTMAMMTL